MNVGTTATLLVPRDERRIAAIIGNLTANNLFVSTEPDVTTTTGILVSASGGTLNINSCQHGTLPQGPLYGIKVTGAGNVSVLEAWRD